ncbi:hypothetical protein GW17_00051108 [Ensete ventricosum]|nr:hypothetical protein GW17_00051108 [Ensete ventricosum]
MAAEHFCRKRSRVKPESLFLVWLYSLCRKLVIALQIGEGIDLLMSWQRLLLFTLNSNMEKEQQKTFGAGEKKEVGDSDDLEVRSASSSLSGNREWLRLGRTIGDVVSGSGVIALAKEEGELSVGKLQCQRKQEKERGIANWWREAWHR